MVISCTREYGDKLYSLFCSVANVRLFDIILAKKEMLVSVLITLVLSIIITGGLSKVLFFLFQ